MSSMELLHSNEAKIYIETAIEKYLVGYMKDIKFNIDFNTYIYPYIGGREVRTDGVEKISISFTQGILMYEELRKYLIFYSSVDIKDFFTQILRKLTLYIYHTPEKYMIVDNLLPTNLSISYSEGNFILFSGELIGEIVGYNV